ncbi:hypothetical protein [Microbulbifer taiwanensis]|uniref:hypothetical protein n=1 Tax=Microbulbifer taiwanensis TaxID=986746 RepID=UPI003609AA98
MKTSLARALLLISAFTLVACGGSGGGDNSGASDGSGNDSGQGSGSDSASITPTAEITRENTRTFAGSAYTFVDVHNTLINNFTSPLDSPSFSSSRNGSNSESCFADGTMTNVVSENGAAESLTFQDCQLQNGLVLDGKLEIATSEADGDGAYDIEFSFSGLTATRATYNLSIDGSALVVVPGSNEDPFRINVVSNLEAVDNRNGELYLAEDFMYELPMGNSSSLTDAENFSGGLGTKSSGMAVLKRQIFDIGDRYTGGSNITGTSDSFGVMQHVGIISSRDLELLYFATSTQNFSSAGVRLRFSDLNEGKFDFFSASNTPPKKMIVPCSLIPRRPTSVNRLPSVVTANT